MQMNKEETSFYAITAANQ